MPNAVLHLGKFGDVISILPILYQNFLLTREKVNLVISKEYASVLDGVSYVTPVIYDGPWHDLKGAMKFAKSKFEKVICLSTFGSNFPIEHRTPSFQLDAWARAECLDKFHEWPLVFDRRSESREVELVKNLPAKFILLADQSESSPFNEIEDLRSLLTKDFPEHTIINLSEIRAEFVCDLLAVYDRATALVTIETVHAHLSAASTVPVISLVADKPEKWHGSAYHPRFRFQCRYADYQKRKSELIQAVKDAVAKTSAPAVEIAASAYEGYNASLIEFGARPITVYRYHPDKTHWRTQLALNTSNGDFKITPPEKFKDYSLEDGRLFIFNGKLHIAYVCARTLDNSSRCVVHYGELQCNENHWSIENQRQPLIKGNEFSGLQKNWSFFESGGKLYCAVQRSPEQIVYELDGEKVVREFKTKTPQWAFGQMRGGTSPIVESGVWLQFFHTQRQLPSAPAWVMGALLMEPLPPFQIMSVSSRPVLAGTEHYFPGNKFWKPNVSICYGAVRVNNSFKVSLGINDSACASALITKEQLFL